MTTLYLSAQNSLPESNRQIRVKVLDNQDKEISLQLSLSQRAIENHRRRVYKKVGSNCTAKIVVYAIKNGIYELDD